jgi:hypothetical protein
MTYIQKVKTVWCLKNLNLKMYIFSTDFKSFSYIIFLKIQVLRSCNEFLYACIMEICHQSIDEALNSLHHYLCAWCPKTSSVRTSENQLEPGWKKDLCTSVMCKWFLLSRWPLLSLLMGPYRIGFYLRTETVQSPN